MTHDDPHQNSYVSALEIYTHSESVVLALSGDIYV